jgi:1-acyl-sn-glycerol-3-phosphate acyltransferase
MGPSSLAKQRALRLPQSSDIIASSFTSPLDALYLGAVFDPIFVASYAGTRQVHRISLRGAMLRAFRAPRERPPPGTPLLDLGALMKAHPSRIVAVFPETTTTNGRGVLRLSPSLLTAPPGARIFPFSLRYTPADVTTPVPGYYATFLWNLLSEPTHCIRVRIAECVLVPSKRQQQSPPPPPLPQQQQQQQQQQKLERPLYINGHAGAFPHVDRRDYMGGYEKSSRPRSGDESAEERQMMDKVAESLARLGRVKRVDLGPTEKLAFIDSWNRNSR